ncbi:MAG: hypothetical protein AAB464_01470 [Patescibacteria group bacterium]
MNIFEILKELKNIKPDQEYAKQSRYLILAQTPVNKKITVAEIFDWISIHRLATAASLIGVFILLVVLSVSYLPGNKNSLVAEADEINASIKIKLNDMGYQLQNPAEININEIPNIQKNLEEVTKLMKEAQILSENNKDKNMGEYLEKIKAAQALLTEIESLLVK